MDTGTGMRAVQGENHHTDTALWGMLRMIRCSYKTAPPAQGTVSCRRWATGISVTRYSRQYQGAWCACKSQSRLWSPDPQN